MVPDCGILGSSPLITVVLSTRNRGKAVAPTIKSILANEGLSFALHIVDQSDDDPTEKLVRGLGNNSGVSYFRTATKGLGLSRNTGIAHVQTELIALTDDDCEVPTTWLLEMIRAFEFRDRVAIVFGNVLPGKHDSSCGFIPAYVRTGACLVSKMSENHKIWGIGACMGLRRSVWVQLAGFDEMLGAGSRFRSAEELDFAIRALQAGHSIYETDRVFVVHNGFRTWAEQRQLTYDYLYGIGAVFGKHLKCRQWSVFAPLFQLGRRWAFAEPLLNYGKRPSRTLRLYAFLAGLRDAVGKTMDLKTCHFAV
jgi:glycosyltransferase involved in cell wall biosynthesis